MSMCTIIYFKKNRVKFHRDPIWNDRALGFLPRDASAERGDATVSCLSVRLSVRNVQVPCSNTLEFFENNFTAK